MKSILIFAIILFVVCFVTTTNDTEHENIFLQRYVKKGQGSATFINGADMLVFRPNILNQSIDKNLFSKINIILQNKEFNFLRCSY